VFSVVLSSFWFDLKAVVGVDLSLEVFGSHSDTLRSIGLLCTSDRPNAEICTRLHITHTNREVFMFPARFEH
jgi:hypothetical protein